MTHRALFISLCLAASAAQAEDLVETYQMGRQNDPQLRAAESGYHATQELLPQNTARFLPSLDASGNYTSNDETINQGTANSYDSQGYSLNLVQPLYHQDAFVQRDIAHGTIEKSRLGYRAAQQDLIMRVTERYFELLGAQDTLDFALAEKKAIERQLQQTKQRFEVGLIAVTDVHEAQARFDLSTAQEIEARNNLANTKEALNEIIGDYPKALKGLSDTAPLPPPDPNDIQYWTDTALHQNLSLQIARSDVEVANSNIQLQRSGHFPSLDLVGHRSYSDTSKSEYAGAERENTSVSVQLTVPIYSGGATSAATRQAWHLFDQSRENMESARRTTLRDTRSAFLGAQASIARVKALQQAVVSTQSALQATEAGLEVGTRTTVDVLDAQREVYRAQRDYAQARYDYILNSMRLKQSAGILDIADIEQINGWLKK